MRRFSSFAGTLAIVAATACTNAGQSLTVPAIGQGALGVSVYFDRDNSLNRSPLDTVFAGVRLALLVPGGTDTIRRATTDSTGVAIFDSLPFGSYRLVVDRHALGDSVGVVAGDTGVVRLISQQDSSTSARIVRLGYSEVSLAQFRTLPAGKRVFVRGKVTVPLQTFRDTSMFLEDTSSSLRVVSAKALPGQVGNNYGDSVLVLGTTALAHGEPVMLGGLAFPISPGLLPVPLVITLRDALTARHDSLDAALVQVTNAVISDTASASPDFKVIIVDPVDSTAPPLTILVDGLLNAPHSYFPIGSRVTVTGVLVPVGDGTWLIKPRGGSDFVIN